MKTITLPADTAHLYLDEVAHLIADYCNPVGPNDPDGVRYELDKIQAENEVHQAAKDDSLSVKHPGTHGPFPLELGLNRAVVLVPDVVAYLAARGIAVVIAAPAPVMAVGASGGVEPNKAGSARPLQRTAAQDTAILCEIEKQGYDPLALPKNLPGKPGVKAAIRAALSQNSLFTGGTVFDKAWERLTARADIAIQG